MNRQEREETETLAARPELEPREFVEALPGEELQALAALDPADLEFNSLVFSHFPPERRQWAVESGLAVESGREGTTEPELELTQRGQRVIELARELCPEPYADVSVEELLEHTRKRVELLMANSPTELVPAGERPFGRFFAGLSKSSSGRGSLFDLFHSGSEQRHAEYRH